MTAATNQLQQITSLLYTIRQDESIKTLTEQRLQMDDLRVITACCQKTQDLLEFFLESLYLLVSVNESNENSKITVWLFDHFDEIIRYLKAYKYCHKDSSNFPFWYCRLGLFLISFQHIYAKLKEETERIIKLLTVEENAFLFQIEK